MCDYSLHAIASRAAKVGDRLLSAGFTGTQTRGFAAEGEPNVAVCLRPGTELVFEREIETAHPFARLLPNFRFGMLGETRARFRRVDAHEPHAHHDALELASGKLVLVTRLREGQRATILQLPVAQAPGQSRQRSDFSAADVMVAADEKAGQ
jgi:hypothetical protein